MHIICQVNPVYKKGGRYYKNTKIWTSYRSNTNKFVYDDTGEYIGLTNTTVIFSDKTSVSLKYLLALLNSKILTFRYKSIGKQTGGGIFEYFENGVGKLPIKVLDLAIPAEKAQHDKMVSLVETMLETQKQNQAAKSDQEKKHLQKKIDLLDNQIDTLVYELYGLTEEEIKIVEEGV